MWSNSKLGLTLCAGIAWIAMPALADQTMTITVTKGFGITQYASDLEDAKQLAMGDLGTLFVGSGKSGTITALVDHNHDGKVDRRYLIGRGLDNPEAIAFFHGDLYVAVDDKILRYEDIEQRLRRPGRPKEVYAKLPNGNKKSARSMAFGPDGRLYIAIGAPCNVCEAEAPFGSIIAIDVNTGASEQIASGLRSVRGMDWSPQDGKLWFADIGRDWMGDSLPPDEINRVDRKGLHYGFPYVHAANVMEPAYEKPKSLRVIAPAFELPAHVSPMGMLFYRGEQFPAEYHNQLLVAENGSWNRSSKIGYQIVVLSLEQGEVTNRHTLISFLDGEFPVARPYSMAMANDGSLFISDDLKGNVYRFFFKQDTEAPNQDE